MPDSTGPGAEHRRLHEDAGREKDWKRWGPYLAERQWGTVREDYSASGDCWTHFPHDQARSRAYRWGEDGLLGICDRQGRLCFALALWNGRDPILKERLFGLGGPEGNHGEDVKESYFFLDATPTASYLKGLYKYPQAEFPYARLVEENRKRGREDREFELCDAGVFDGDRYFDVFAEYAKASPDDVLIRVTVQNRGPEAARIHLLPTLWFANTWSWGRHGEGYWKKPQLAFDGTGVQADHESLGRFWLRAEGPVKAWLFTENESNTRRLWGLENAQPFVKDAFHEYVVRNASGAVNPALRGTKAAPYYVLDLPARGSAVLRLRLGSGAQAPPAPFSDFDAVLQSRRAEADEFYGARISPRLSADERQVARQAYAGLVWSKQFYHYIVEDWLQGDPLLAPPPERKRGRNWDWGHLYARDILSMPDTWEYPWFAGWDLAFHMIAFARIDPDFAKQQLLLLLREWYMHPNGQLPAYEFAFGDVNPPVHAWACWRIYKMTGARGVRDRLFLERAFHKLCFNFSWWVNRKDDDGDHLFSGGFLGLDNIGVFDRSKPLPSGGHLDQADGTAWMAFYCATMLSISLELAREDPAYEDVASRFFEQFIMIADAANSLGGTGLWNEQDGFYYDQMSVGNRVIPLRVRSLVGLIPLFAVELLDDATLSRLPMFTKRLDWFCENRKDLADRMSLARAQGGKGPRLLSIPSRDRLVRVLRYVLDEREFLSPFGVRSLSRYHEQHPFVMSLEGVEYRVDYAPGESTCAIFGGNSNWRGPIWFPANYLLIEALERYHHFYGDDLKVECPPGSGRKLSLHEVASELAARLVRLFLPGQDGRRPAHGDDDRFRRDPAWRDLVLFYEYFHAETGRGVGASHQTGWTSLVVRWLEDLARERGARA